MQCDFHLGFKPKERYIHSFRARVARVQLWTRGRGRKDISKSRHEGGTEKRLRFPWRDSTSNQLCGESLFCGTAFFCLTWLEHAVRTLSALYMPTGLGDILGSGRATETGQKEYFPRGTSFFICLRFHLIFMCPPYHALPVTWLSLMLISIGRIFLQVLRSDNPASFLHVFISDLPTSHMFCCAPEYTSSGLCFFLQ